jgi:predicted alpha/beta-hydrolase family hydrolase
MKGSIAIATGGGLVSATLDEPPKRPVALLVLAHGAGAAREHPAMHRLSLALVGAGLSVARFNFPYSEAGRKMPDRSQVLIQTWLDVFSWARSRVVEDGLPILAGGRSMGGRMASLAAAERGDSFTPSGLVFFAYPLHRAGSTGNLRMAHLRDLQIPMLFISGTRDALAEVELLEAETRKLGRRARLHRLEGADHGFHVLKRSGRTDEDMVREAGEAVRGWADSILASRKTAR